MPFWDSRENKIHQKPLNALPPWAVELNNNVDGQIVGKILDFENSFNKESTNLHLIVTAHLNPINNRDMAKDHMMTIRVYNKIDVERIKNLIMKPTSEDRDYLISFKTIKRDGVKWFELITIDPYMD